MGINVTFISIYVDKNTLLLLKKSIISSLLHLALRILHIVNRLRIMPTYIF